MWYMWCGKKSPLFGRDRMTTFERCPIEDKSAHTEPKNAYYRHTADPAVCDRILREFGLEGEHAHIINGHMPVKIKDGESPIHGQRQDAHHRRAASAVPTRKLPALPAIRWFTMPMASSSSPMSRSRAGRIASPGTMIFSPRPRSSSRCPSPRRWRIRTSDGSCRPRSTASSSCWQPTGAVPSRRQISVPDLAFPGNR